MNKPIFVDIHSKEKLEDIIKMMFPSMMSPPLHHKEVNDRHVYFIPVSLALGREVIYFVKMKEKVGKKCVVLDMFYNKMSFSDEFSTRPSLKHFQIVEVKAQNVLSTEAV